MIELEKKNWDYILYKNKEDFYLNIIMGNAGLYEFGIKLNQSETNGYLNKGISYIEKLITDIRVNTENYSDRQMKINYGRGSKS